MDISLNYHATGHGEALVLLHGNGEDYTYFSRQVEPFSTHYRVIAVDTRGHGRSPRGTAPFTLEQFAEDLKQLLDQLDIQRCHLLGFSDGGNIALLFALKYPHYVNRLIINGANLHPSGMKWQIHLPIVLQWAAFRLLCAVNPNNQKWVQRYELLVLMATQPHIDCAHLAEIAVPTLVVAGTNDMIRTAHTRAIAAAIPGSRVELLPGDHFVARRNWPEFNQLVQDFLADTKR